jgi:hypothetical protein
LSIVLWLAWPPSNVAAPVKALRFGKLVDGNCKVVSTTVIVIEKDRIKSIGTCGTAIPSLDFHAGK